MDKVQIATVNVLSRVMGGRNLNQVLSEEMRGQSALTPQQRGALQDLSYGTLRHYGQLMAILDLLLNKPLQDIQVKYLLLAAIYQLQYSKAPEHAVVDFAVSTVRKISPAAGGLVNAVLRNYIRRKKSLLQDASKSEEGRYSYPLWWIKQIKSQYGSLAESILLAGNLHPPMTLRVNKRLNSTADYLAILEQNGILATQLGTSAVLLNQPLPVDRLPGFKEGRVSVQDAGAQHAAIFLDIKDGMHVLDACAAPGGKSAHLLETADIQLVALDKDTIRLERVEQNMVRLNLEATLLTGDASEPGDWWSGKPFQRILADVPCSASGVVRRHPDIKWLRRPSDIESFALQQLQILNSLWPLLETGGKMLYATCSIFERENQQVLNEFLYHHKDAQQLPLEAPGMNNGQMLPTSSQDGFYYVLLLKQK